MEKIFESGRRHARYRFTFYFIVTCHEVYIGIYIYNTFVPEVRTLQGFILDLVCGPPWLLELLPTISPVPTSILKFVKNPDPSPPPATESTPRRPFSLPINLRNFQLSRWKNRLPFLSTRKDDTKRREKKEREKKQID